MITAKEIRSQQRICEREREISVMLLGHQFSPNKKSMTYDCYGQPLSQRIQKKLKEAGYTVKCSFSKSKVPNDWDYGERTLKRWKYTIGW